MSFPATAITVMIASPSDVNLERSVVREVIHDWNDLNAAKMGIVLLPVGWETHATPLLGVRPQQRINEAVLDKSDILVGVFWTRLGTPTGVAESGTVEEIKRHISTGKPAMLYFSSAPVVPDSLDAHQYESLKSFKDWAKGEGLVEIYDDALSFRDAFRRHLHQIVVEKFDGAAAVEGLVAIEKNSKWLSDEAEDLLFEAVRDSQGQVQNMHFVGGRRIRTNGRDFINDDTPRTTAKWIAAVEELQGAGMITLGTQLCRVTEKGYRYAESRKR